MINRRDFLSASVAAPAMALSVQDVSLSGPTDADPFPGFPDHWQWKVYIAGTVFVNKEWSALDDKELGERLDHVAENMKLSAIYHIAQERKKGYPGKVKQSLPGKE
jgi:UDP-N-acetylglucosamine enolpyruvyl transferase